VVDLTSIFEDEVATMQGVVGRAAGVKPGDVLIVASHTFSAPHIMPTNRPFPGLESEVEQRKNAVFKQAVEDALGAAAKTASDGVRPARLGFGRGVSDVNVNRDQHTPEGFWLGVDSAGPSDKTLSVVRIEDEARRPIALLANYAVQPRSWTRRSCRRRQGGHRRPGRRGHAAGGEPVWEGLVSFFLIGAAGDQAPILKARSAPFPTRTAA
jgi:neutral ceramidase